MKDFYHENTQKHYTYDIKSNTKLYYYTKIVLTAELSKKTNLELQLL